MIIGLFILFLLGNFQKEGMESGVKLKQDPDTA